MAIYLSVTPVWMPPQRAQSVSQVTVSYFSERPSDRQSMVLGTAAEAECTCLLPMSNQRDERCENYQDFRMKLYTYWSAVADDNNCLGIASAP